MVSGIDKRIQKQDLQIPGQLICVEGVRVVHWERTVVSTNGTSTIGHPYEKKQTLILNHIQKLTQNG